MSIQLLHSTTMDYAMASFALHLTTITTPAKVDAAPTDTVNRAPHAPCRLGSGS